VALFKHYPAWIDGVIDRAGPGFLRLYPLVAPAGEKMVGEGPFTV
jgi:hypothetical protein